MVQQWDPGYHAVEGRYYLHHPILLHHYIALGILLFGDNVVTVRLLPVCFTLLLVVLIFFVGERAFGSGPGLFGAALFAILPMVVSFNILPDHQHQGAFYSLLGMFLYLGWLRHGGRWRIGVALAAFVLTAFSDWTPYLYCFVFGCFVLGHAVKRRSKKELVAIAGMVLAFAIPLAVHFALIKLLGAQADMRQSFAQRTGGPDPKTIAKLIFDNQLLMYTKPVVGLCGLWLITLLVRLFLGKLSLWHIIPFSMLVAQVVYVFLFREGVYVHIYRTYYAGVAYALAAADMMGLLVRAAHSVWRTVADRDDRSRRPRAASSWLGTVFCTVVGLVFLASVAHASYPVFLESRLRSGSIGHKGYSPDLERLVFGRYVNEHSNPTDLVLVHASFQARYEFYWYLDRDMSRTSALFPSLAAATLRPRLPSERILGKPAVYDRQKHAPKTPVPPHAASKSPSLPSGAQPTRVSKTPERERGKLLILHDSALSGSNGEHLLSTYPCTKIGHFVLADLRQQGPQYRAYRLVASRPKGALRRFLGGPHEREWQLERDFAEEWRVVLAYGLPPEDRPQPPKPSANDRTGWLRYGQAAALRGDGAHVSEAQVRLATLLSADTGREAYVAALRETDLGDGLVVDKALWRTGPTLTLLLRAASRPAQKQSLIVELWRVGSAAPARLKPPALAATLPRATDLTVGRLRPPKPSPLIRHEIVLTPPTDRWVEGFPYIEQWSTRLQPGVYRAWLYAKPGSAKTEETARFLELGDVVAP